MAFALSGEQGGDNRAGAPGLVRAMLLALALASMSGGSARADDPCSRYLEAYAVKSGTERLAEQRQSMEAAELFGTAAARWRAARAAVIESRSITVTSA